MSRIDTLPADQRAVLQLLLRQGRSYHDLSGMLRLDEGAVRRRAHDALAALGPADVADLPADRRNAIADYLLGQDAEEERLVTYSFLEGSPGGRAWARAVAGELREVAADGLPEIPGGGDDAAVATAAATSAAAITETDADADPHADPEAAAAFEAEPAADRPRSSRRGGAILLAALAVAAVAAVLVLVLTGGGDDTPADTTTPAASTTGTDSQAQVEAQANLVPPSNRRGLKALGVVLVQRANGKHQIVAAVQGLPKPKRGGYGIWLYSGPGKAQWLGFFASRDNQGRLLARGEITASVGDYREVLVTREAKGDPPQPGPIFLRGPVQTASSTGG